MQIAEVEQGEVVLITGDEGKYQHWRLLDEDGKIIDPITRAAELGKEHGSNAASWVFNGPIPDGGYAKILEGIDDGDPEVLDKLPSPDLSGQDAGSMTPAELLVEIGVYEPLVEQREMWASQFAELEQQCCDAYEEAFTHSVEFDVAHTCRYHLNPEA